MSPAACLTLVCLQRALLTHFHQLKTVVCKACQREDRRIASRQLWQPLHSGGWRQGLGRKAELTTWLYLWFLRREHVRGFLGEFVLQSCFGREPFWGQAQALPVACASHGLVFPHTKHACHKSKCREDS